MNDLALFFGGIGGIFLACFVIYYVDKFSGCWHKWGDWHEDSTDVAYVQWRSCTKCGYTEREQWRKITEGK